ncbi:hypothetical protein [Azospirillum aestuarii]|uniref:hypothetical protein n=1 Tax=Azospirillum aestuarii TaxID=2802052 RepID=UPI004054C96B
MLERLRAQERLLSEADAETAFAFLDTDTLVLKELSEVFSTTFDVGVTIRDRPRHHFEVTMPYNNGVIFAKENRAHSANAYFSHIRKMLESSPAESWAWSGNQFVVRDLLGIRAPGETTFAGGARVHIFPCTTHNYTPFVPGEDLTEKYIVHFRGEAKPLMRHYAAPILGGKTL